MTCLEPAERPAEKAREKGLNVLSTKFQDFSTTQTFDALFALSSLIHITRSEMPQQIEKMSQLLRKNGVAFVSFIEGSSESYEDPTGKGKIRFFSKFTESELKSLLLSYFSIIEIQKIESKSMHQTFFLLVLSH